MIETDAKNIFSECNKECAKNPTQNYDTFYQELRGTANA